MRLGQRCWRRARRCQVSSSLLTLFGDFFKYRLCREQKVSHACIVSTTHLGKRLMLYVERGSFTETCIAHLQSLPPDSPTFTRWEITVALVPCADVTASQSPLYSARWVVFLFTIKRSKQRVVFVAIYTCYYTLFWVDPRTVARASDAGENFLPTAESTVVGVWISCTRAVITENTRC